MNKLLATGAFAAPIIALIILVVLLTAAITVYSVLRYIVKAKDKNVPPSANVIVRMVFGAVMSAYTIIVGALVIWQVLNIYLSGTSQGLTSPFTYELVSERVSGILAVPLWIWIGLIFVGLILWEIFPVAEKRAGISDERYLLYRLQKRIPDEVGEELKESFGIVKKEQSVLKKLRIALYVFAALYVVYIIIYMCIPSNFPNVNKTGEVLKAAAFLLPVAAVVYAAGCAYVVYLKRSAKRQLPHVKAITKGIKGPQPVVYGKVAAVVHSKYFILAIRIALACLGVAFVIAGCFNGSIMEVFNKAIRICTECIGLG